MLVSELLSSVRVTICGTYQTGGIQPCHIVVGLCLTSATEAKDRYDVWAPALEP